MEIGFLLKKKDLEKSAVSGLFSAEPAVLDIFWSDHLSSITGSILHELLDGKGVTSATSKTQVGETGSRALSQRGFQAWIM